MTVASGNGSKLAVLASIGSWVVAGNLAVLVDDTVFNWAQVISWEAGVLIIQHISYDS